jgi:hypothetical protein
MGISTEHSRPHSDNDNSPAPRQLRTVVQSWKEIASELNRGVRTMQRWERTLGLPVHRLGRGPRSPVFAFKEELHLWFRKTARARDLETTQSPPSESPSDPRSKQSVSARSGRSRAKRSLRKERALSGMNAKPGASILQSINRFFALECSRHKQQNCQYCHSELRFLEGHFSLYGTDMKWRIAIPYCPSCDWEIVREFCQFPTIH